MTPTEKPAKKPMKGKHRWLTRQHVIGRMFTSPNQRANPKHSAANVRVQLDAVNEVLAEKGVMLRATKGFEKLNVKRDLAAMVTTQLKEPVPVPKVKTKVKGFNCCTREDSKTKGKGWPSGAIRAFITQ